jgi:hypothetical protein
MNRRCIASDYIRRCFESWIETHTSTTTETPVTTLKRKRSTFDLWDMEVEIEMCPVTHCVTQYYNPVLETDPTQFQFTFHDFMVDDGTRYQMIRELFRQIDKIKVEMLERFKHVLPSVQSVCISIPLDRQYSLTDEIIPPPISSASYWTYSHKPILGGYHCWYFGRISLTINFVYVEDDGEKYDDDDNSGVILDLLTDFKGSETTLAEIAKFLNESEDVDFIDDGYILGKMYHVREFRDGVEYEDYVIPDVDMYKPIRELVFTSDMTVILELHPESIFNMGRFL